LLCPRCRAAWPADRDRCPNDGWKLIHDRRGQRLAGCFDIDDLLGVGGSGSSVWVARDARARDRKVALKLQETGDAQALARFERGAILAESLDHPNIARVSEHGRDGSLAWICMDLLDGEPLASRIAVSKTMSAKEAVLLVDQVLAALEVAHTGEIVHRDLKPANLFVARTPTPNGLIEERVLILDFGIARLVGPSAAERFGPFFPDDDPIAPELESEVTGEHRICGTPEYMAPEQILGGPPDVRSDFYALGVILHRLVVGQLPFRARSRYELYHRHLHEPPPPLLTQPPLPIPFCAAVHRALAKEATSRFPSASEMRAVLREAVGLPPVKRPRLFPTEVELRPPAGPPPLEIAAFGISPLPTVPPPAAHPATPPSPPPRPERRRWIYSAVSVAAVVAAIVAYLTLSGSESPATTGDVEVTAGARH